eukprot:GAHX01000275.1.p1 GENE.GAHX01000275.1~~GAHX01000275.1.p1  ORF type:complete len:276 (+),score=59.17 GAHX01000275.1:38-865(+)
MQTTKTKGRLFVIFISIALYVLLEISATSSPDETDSPKLPNPELDKLKDTPENSPKKSPSKFKRLRGILSPTPKRKGTDSGQNSPVKTSDKDTPGNKNKVVNIENLDDEDDDDILVVEVDEHHNKPKITMKPKVVKKEVPPQNPNLKLENVETSNTSSTTQPDPASPKRVTQVTPKTTPEKSPSKQTPIKTPLLTPILSRRKVQESSTTVVSYEFSSDIAAAKVVNDEDKKIKKYRLILLISICAVSFAILFSVMVATLVMLNNKEKIKGTFDVE